MEKIMPKYKIPVTISTLAYKHIGSIECDSLEEYNKKSEELWKAQNYEHPTTNISNKFDLSDWEIDEVKDCNLKYYDITEK